MDELVSALERTLELLQKSKFDGGLVCIEQAIPLLETQIENYKRTQKFTFWGKCKIRFLFLPTNELQEISVLNDWGNEYLEIAKVVDKYLN